MIHVSFSYQLMNASKITTAGTTVPATKSLKRAWLMGSTKVNKKLSSILISVKKNVRRKNMIVS